ncbi:MAG: UDP-N-acetylmuramate--L-alanine ligase [Candidatus Omnitrophota bacterium]
MKKYYHFIGIGGIGMSGIAQLLLKSGYKVSGSDLKENQNTDELKSLGATIFMGHAAKNIIEQDVVVYSSAISSDNPELCQAKALGKTLIKRAQALAALMQDKKAITVAGSHGKTTTTSLVSYMLLEAGLRPTVAIGGVLNNIQSNACLGNGDYFVAEADESDGSFLNYSPTYSIITNIDREHLDYYHNFENEIQAFKTFIKRTEKDGVIFICYDDLNLLKLVSAYKGKCLTFGLKPGADIYATNIVFNGLSSEFDCYVKKQLLGRFCLSLGGKHNISNSLAVIALGLELGIDLEFIRKALAGYQGAGRRLETKFCNNQYLVLDDYAHHPCEIKATLAAIDNLKGKRKIVVFQPHRYSRTQLLLDDFAQAFDQADYLIITDIYAASEKPISGVNAEKLLSRIKENFKDKVAIYLPKEDILNHLLEMISKNDLVITLGAGDIVKISNALAQELKN